MDSSALALKAIKGGRLSPDGRIKDVREDHVARYRWAAERLEGAVIDAGCNCGYGSAILADSGLDVVAVDCWEKGLKWALKNWDRPIITWMAMDLITEVFALPSCDAVVAFEVIEHLADPVPFLVTARKRCPRLLASVPNEEIWPWQPRLAPVHHRHYTKDQFNDLLSSCGWKVSRWWGQEGGKSPVEPDINGRTLVVECL